MKNLGGPSKFTHMIKGHLANLARGHRLAYLASTLWGSLYGWGDEVIGNADCSGSVFWALWLMGYPVRLNAHGLRHQYCVKLHREPKAGDLAFWWEGDKVKHVAVFVEPGIIFNASPPFAHYVTIEDEVNERKREGQQFEPAEVVWNKLDCAKEDGAMKAYDVNQKLRPLLGLMEVD